MLYMYHDVHHVFARIASDFNWARGFCHFHGDGAAAARAGKSISCDDRRVDDREPLALGHAVNVRIHVTFLVVLPCPTRKVQLVHIQRPGSESTSVNSQLRARSTQAGLTLSPDRSDDSVDRAKARLTSRTPADHALQDALVQGVAQSRLKER